MNYREYVEKRGLWTSEDRLGYLDLFKQRLAKFLDKNDRLFTSVVSDYADDETDLDMHKLLQSLMVWSLSSQAPKEVSDDKVNN